MTKKLPKFKLRLSLAQGLFLILVVAVALEGYILYQAFYASVDAAPTDMMAAPVVPVAVKLDLAEYDKIKNWLENNRSYELADYNLVGVTGTSTNITITGRENPFAQ